MNIEHRTSNIERRMEEWIPILKKIIGQDQQDRLDSAAFGRKPLAAGE